MVGKNSMEVYFCCIGSCVLTTECFVLQVQLNGRTLETEVEVTNTGGDAFDFQAALHSYFRCSDINKARGGDIDYNHSVLKKITD